MKVPDYTIQNVVSTFNGGVASLNLRVLSMELAWCQFNPEVFAALIGRLQDPKTTLLTFSSANNVCTGANSEIDSRIACRIMVSALQDIGVHACMRDFIVQNIVASAYTGFPIKLEEIAKKHRAMANFERGFFPGLIYKMVDEAAEIKLVFLVFDEGKVVITGAKKKHQIDRGWAIFYTDVLLPNKSESSQKQYFQAAPVCENVMDEFITKIMQIDVDPEEEHTQENPAQEDMTDMENKLADVDWYEKAYAELE